MITIMRLLCVFFIFLCAYISFRAFQGRAFVTVNPDNLRTIGVNIVRERFTETLVYWSLHITVWSHQFAVFFNG